MQDMKVALFTIEDLKKNHPDYYRRLNPKCQVYGKKKTGIEKMEKELHCRVSGQKLVEDAESGYKDVRELFNQFITGPKGENREIPELTQAYERLRAVMEAQVPGAKADTAITSAVYDVAIESEMQGFIYGFQLFGAVLQGCGNTRRCAGEN